MPYIHVLVNNSYLGLIRQAQMNFKMDFNVKLDFDNINEFGQAIDLRDESSEESKKAA